MIIVLNAGSSSIKFELFDQALDSLFKGAATEIGADAALTGPGGTRPIDAPDHKAALSAVFGALLAHGFAPDDLAAAGHRVVHGGAHFSQPVAVDEDNLALIETATPLAPLHNPHNLAGIRAISALRPDLAQFASFDTAFHAKAPDIATRYALPEKWHQKGLRRYGFHGLSYASIVARLDPLPDRLLAFHLGNGASACAIHKGVSVATTMGYSPVSGLTMGTRTGDIDAMAVLELADHEGIDQAREILNRRSGLLGLGGTHDMRVLMARTDDAAKSAIAHFCYWAIRHGASLAGAMGGCDAIIFTGGIGENAPQIRHEIAQGLGFLNAGEPLVIAADEERQIARDALQLIRDNTTAQTPSTR